MKIHLLFSLLILTQISCFDNSKEKALEAKNLFDNGKYVEAIEILNHIIERHPQDTSSYSLRGKSYYLLSDFIKAKDDFSEVIRLNPNSVNSYFFKGSCEAANENHSQVIEDITMFFSQKAKYNNKEGIIQDTSAYLVRGLSFYNLKNYTRSKADLMSYNFLGGKDPKAYLCMGYMDIQFGSKRDGFRFIDKAASLGNKEAKDYLANNNEEAEEYLPEKSVASDTRNSENRKVSYSEARDLVDSRISGWGGSIIDSFTSQSYGPRIYTFLVTYKDSYCNMAVTELKLEVIATNCNGNAFDAFYIAKDAH